MRYGTSFAMLGLLALVGAAADAQTCSGRPGPEAGRVQLIGTYGSTTGAKEFGLSVIGIGERAFGGADLGSISYDEFSGSTTVLGGSAGYQVPTGTSGRAQLCPVISAGLGSGPKNIGGSGVDAHVRGVSVGVEWGYRVGDADQPAFIPTIGVGFAYSEFELTDGLNSVTESDTFGQVGFGVGIVLGRQLTALPYISLPLGLEDSDPTVSISLSLSLGPRR